VSAWAGVAAPRPAGDLVEVHALTCHSRRCSSTPASVDAGEQDEVAGLVDGTRACGEYLSATCFGRAAA
jgi:hypothetical protein